LVCCTVKLMSFFTNIISLTPALSNKETKLCSILSSKYTRLAAWLRRNQPGSLQRSTRISLGGLRGGPGTPGQKEGMRGNRTRGSGKGGTERREYGEGRRQGGEKEREERNSVSSLVTPLHIVQTVK